MKNRPFWAKALLGLHLFVCCVWLFLIRATEEPPVWMFHVLVWSVLAVQFTWGFTVGFIIGPSRKRRPLLWWSLLTVFMPLYFVGFMLRALVQEMGVMLALIYLAVFSAILACETFGGVLLGAKTHSETPAD